MGFPAETLERFYRNHIEDVVRLFDSKHKSHYRIYNLCSESKRCYDTTKFHGQVNVEYSFKDHNPPPFSILKPFCEELTEWLKADEENVAGIHCKAGKGRTGVMICAYLVHEGGYEDADGLFQVIGSAEEALDYYAKYRTRDLKGVTIPSQKRYVFYYEELVKRQLEYTLVHLNLTSIILSSAPAFNGGSYTLICKVYEILPKSTEWTLTSTFSIESKRNSKSIVHNLPEGLCLAGDVKFVFYLKNTLLGRDTKVFQVCVNTFFFEYGTDVSTVLCESCSRCHGKMATVISSGKKEEESSAGPHDDTSVINDDVSFLPLAYNSRNEAHHNCDCTLASNPPRNIYLHSNRSPAPRKFASICMHLMHLMYANAFSLSP